MNEVVRGVYSKTRKKGKKNVRDLKDRFLNELLAVDDRELVVHSTQQIHSLVE